MKFLTPLMSLPTVYRLSGTLWPLLGLLCLGCVSYGLLGGLWIAPGDAVQGEMFRVIYIHVPAAFLSLMVYTIIFVSSVIYLIWHIKVFDIIAEKSASIGMMYTLIALLTGALWGKPLWGTWWIWDARLTSELILLFLYWGYMGLRHMMLDSKRGAKTAAILAIMGMVDIPIIHFSVEWWATLHQGATLAKFSKPAIAPLMLYPLLAMIMAFILWYMMLLCIRIRSEILRRSYYANPV